MGRPSKQDRLFIRLAVDGSVVADSAMWRTKKPTSGRWKDITSCVLTCCDPEDSFIVFRNSTASADITSISFNGFSWTGTLANDGYLVVKLPYNYGETITIVTSAFSGRTLTTSTVQGNGTISAIGALAAVTNTTTITSDTASQYLVVLS